MDVSTVGIPKEFLDPSRPKKGGKKFQSRSQKRYRFGFRATRFGHFRT